MARKKLEEVTDQSNIHPALLPMKVPVGALTPDPKNARAHGEANIDAIAHSLKEFGQRKPIVVRKEGMVILAGNGTFTAAKKLGWSHIAALVVDEDEMKSRAFALADNRTGELATWDFATLTDTFKELEAEGLLTGLGWDEKELRMLMHVEFKPDEVQELPTTMGDGESNHKIDKAKLSRMVELYEQHATANDTFSDFVLRAVMSHCGVS